MLQASIGHSSLGEWAVACRTLFFVDDNVNVDASACLPSTTIGPCVDDIRHRMLSGLA